MKKTVLAIICCMLLVSCGYPTRTVYRDLFQEDASFTLYNIRIHRWEGLRFSGLLALQIKADGVSYALLDPSGITLLEAEIGADGEHKLLQAKGEMQTSALPEYLSTSFYRIFGVDPEEYPCSRDGLITFCLKTSKETGWVKEVLAGPFTVWQAKGGMAGDTGEPELVYEQPWGGVHITLKKLNR